MYDSLLYPLLILVLFSYLVHLKKIYKTIINTFLHSFFLIFVLVVLSCYVFERRVLYYLLRFMLNIWLASLQVSSISHIYTRVILELILLFFPSP